MKEYMHTIHGNVESFYDDELKTTFTDTATKWYLCMLEEVESGDAVITVVDTTPEVTYADNRTAEYASITDQLDMQYHDSINGTTTWVDHVEAVKTKYPKG